MNSVTYILTSDGTTVKAINGTTGATDYSGTDLGAILGSIASAATSGATVVFREGVFPQTTNFSMSAQSDFEFRGSGKATVIQAGSSFSNTSDLWDFFNCDGITIEDLVLDGNKANRSSATAGAGLVFLGSATQSGKPSTNVRIRNVEVKNNIDSGLYFNNCSNVWVTDNYLHDNGINSSSLSASGVEFDGNSSIPGTGFGGPCYQILVMRNYCYKNLGAGISFAANGSSAHANAIIKGNLCSTNGAGATNHSWRNGINIDKGTGTANGLYGGIISENDCSSNDFHGIRLMAQEVAVIGNVCINNGQADSAHDGISCENPSSYLTIVGNSCTNTVTTTQRYGINLNDSNVANSVAAQNNLLGNQSAALNNAGATSNRITGNLGYNPQGRTTFAIPSGSSPYVWHNTYTYPITVLVIGGTVSALAISRDNVTYDSLSINGPIVMQPGDYLKTTYTSPPTLYIYPQ